MRYLVEGPHMWTVVEAGDAEQAALDGSEGVRFDEDVLTVTVTPLDDRNQAKVNVRRTVEIA